MTDAIRVLYVDDEHGLLDLGKLFLERTGNFSVTLIDSASAALDLLKTEQFDAIISDYQMPEMDGIAFLKKLKASGNPTPFIIFTGKGREVVVIEALNEGAAFYLQKGGEPKSQFAELSHKIRQAVNRKRAEEALHESELFLKETQQIARLGGWKANPHTDYLVWTDGIYDIIEAPRDYRPGLTEGMKYYAPEDIPAIREKLVACLATGKPFAIEVQIITETGKKVWTELRGLAPVIEGARSYVMGTLQDITEQKRVEKSLRDSGRQLNSMATNIPGVVYRFCVNPDGTYGFDYISGHSWQILGLENDPVTFFNQVVEGIVPEDRERFLSSVQHAISTKTLWEFAGWYVKPSGKKIWFGSVSSPVMENERLVFDGVVFDNTDRKRAEYELLKKNEELNASYEQISAAEEELRGQYGELVRSEQLIRESETKFRELAELLPQMVFEVDLGFWVTYANQIALTNMRVADKDLEAGVSALSFIDPSDRERIRQNVEKIFRGETVANHEYTAVRGDGNTFPVMIYAAPISRFGKPAGIRGIIVDITDRKKAEDTLREQQQQLNNFMQNLPVGIFRNTPGPQGRRVMVNPIIATMHGYDSIEELMQHPISDMYPDPVQRKIISDHLIKEGALSGVEIQLKKKNGELFWASLSAIAVRGPSGEVEYFDGVLDDITDRKKAEAALQESEDRFRTLADAALEGIMIHDNGIITDCNPQFAALFGFKPEEIIGRNGFEFMMTAESRDAIFRWIQNGAKGTIDVTGIKKDGTRFYGETASTNILLQGKQLTIVQMHDITARKESEQILQKQKDELNATYEQIAAAEEELREQYDTLARNEKMLRESEERFKTLFEKSAEAQLLLDGMGKVADCNAAFLTLFALKDKGEIRGHTPEDFAPEFQPDGVRSSERGDEIMATVVKDGMVRYEWAHQKHDPAQTSILTDVICTLILIAGQPMIHVSIRDITDRKKAEEALQESEQNYRGVIENLQDVFYRADAAGNITMASPSASDVFGYSSVDEVIGLNLARDFYTDPENRKDFLTSIQKTGSVKNFEAVLKKKDGSPVIVSTSAHYYHDPDGNVLGVEGIAKDITERKRAEEALRDSEAKFRAVIDQSFQFIGLMTTDGTLIEANRSALAFAGISGSDVINQPFWETPWWSHSKELQEKLKDAIQRAASGETIRLEASHPAADGHLAYVDFSIKPMVDSTGRILYLIPEGRDITERKQAEEVLRKNEEQLRNTIDLVNDGIQINQIGPDGKPGKFIEVNEVACRMLQYTRKELLDLGPFDIVTGYHSRPLPEILKELSSTGHSFFETEHRRKDGTVIPVEINTNIVNLLGQQQVVSVVRDITERKRAEAALKENEEKYRFLIENSHDIIYTIDSVNNLL